MTKITLLCLIDGTDTPFPVDIEPTKTVGHLKQVIKTGKSPKLDRVAADELTLWNVSFPVVPKKDRKAISLCDVLVKELFDEVTDLSEVFTGEPPKKTIHVIVQLPTSVSERQFVGFIPPPIEGVDQAQDGSHSGRTYMVTPSKVATWTDFTSSVRRMSLDDAAVHNPPVFTHTRRFYSEQGLYAIFTHDVGSVSCLHPPTETLAPPAIFRGYPDLMCRRQDDGKILILVEIKRPVIVNIADDTTFAETYNRGQDRSVMFSLHQILGYLWCNGFRYGVLSTMQQTWFLRRTRREIEISPTIALQSQEPTLLKAYLWFIRQAHADPLSSGPPPTKQEVRNMVDPEGGDSDYGILKKLTSKLAPGKKSSTKDPPGKAVQTAQFQNMTLLSCDEGAATFRAKWEGNDVVVKKCDLYKQPEVAQEILREAYIYSSLKELQGRYIPTVMLEGISDGIEMVLVTNYAGTNIANRVLTRKDCDEIREAFMAIHNLGIVHNDVRPENIVAHEIENTIRFLILDFGSSKWTRNESEIEHELERLESLLGSLTH
ncbi:hypothetical protein BGX34_004507 [Mortierella sp. NVP85]|nr:hypothetical protein BGX34_004507 [Mortierella sp. NVP85]